MKTKKWGELSVTLSPLLAELLEVYRASFVKANQVSTHLNSAKYLKSGVPVHIICNSEQLAPSS